jgi:L-rhamnose mutarotase
MPKPKIFTYEKKVPFRDAFLFIVVCEGTNREPDYFRFFDGMSSRVKVVPVPSTLGSAPRLLIDIAIEKVKELDANDERDRLWFVIDTDRWREQLHEIREECEQHPNWRVAQSNPCFEVWLYFHAKAQKQKIENIEKCNQWKSLLPQIIKGGFTSDTHPIGIETAAINAKTDYKSTGYFPDLGSTQVWSLAEELLPLIKKELDHLKHKFPGPVVIG